MSWPELSLLQGENVMGTCNSLSAATIFFRLAIGTAGFLLANVCIGQEARLALEQYGSMHETIGQQQHQGRIQLKAILKQPHFYGVGALEQLRGEISIFDGKPVVTAVDSDGTLKPLNDKAHSLHATLLVGGRVNKWREVKPDKPVGADDFDKWLGDLATASGIDTNRPFLFTLEGEFQDIRLHVINGACPLHARLRNKRIGEGQQPFEREFDTISGKVVGVFARDAVGKLTHPATSVHAHLIFADEDGALLTGHLEQVGLGRHTTIRLPLGEGSKR